MNKEEEEVVLVTTAGILTTLLEMDGTAPKSIIQMALQSKYPVFTDLYRFQLFLIALEKIGWIKQTPNLLMLTSAGTAKAQEIEAGCQNGEV